MGRAHHSRCTLRCPGNAIARHRIAQFSKSIAFLRQVLWQGWSSAESASDLAPRTTSRLPATFAGLCQQILAVATTRTMGCSISHFTFVSEPAPSSCGCVERKWQNGRCSVGKGSLEDDVLEFIQQFARYRIGALILIKRPCKNDNFLLLLAVH